MQQNMLNRDSRAEFGHDGPASNTAAVITQAADANHFWAAIWVAWSYDAAPTGGKLTIAVNSVTVFEVNITAGGPGQFVFPDGLYAELQTKNHALVITLAAGGAGVTGKVTAGIL